MSGHAFSIYDTPRSLTSPLWIPSYSRQTSGEKPPPLEKPPHLRGKRKDSNISGSLFGSTSTEDDWSEDNGVTLTSFNRFNTHNRKSENKNNTVDFKITDSDFERKELNKKSEQNKLPNPPNSSRTVDKNYIFSQNTATTVPVHVDSSPTYDTVSNFSIKSDSRRQISSNQAQPSKNNSNSKTLPSQKTNVKSNISAQNENKNEQNTSNNPNEEERSGYKTGSSSTFGKGTNLRRKESLSTSELDKVGRSEESKYPVYQYRNRQSSFATGRRSAHKKSVYLDLGVYQTLVRPGKALAESEETLSSDDLSCDEERDLIIDGRYGETREDCGGDTLRALNVIENKFDSFRRRQLRDTAFRDASFDSDPSELVKINQAERSNKNHSGHVSGLSKPEQNITTHDPAPNNPTELTEMDVTRIELFFKSQDATVYACRCLADAYIGSSQEGSLSVHEDSQKFLGCGVPVLLFNSGTKVTRRRRELTVLLAHRNTGLPLWQDKITYLSEYQQKGPAVHTMRVSGSVSKSVRFEFKNEISASEFYTTYRSLTSNPRDQLWRVSGEDESVLPNKTKKHAAQIKKSRQMNNDGAEGVTDLSNLRKGAISRPCNVELVTSVDPEDKSFLAAFGNLISKKIQNSEDKVKNNSGSADEVDQGFRPRLPTH